MWTNGHRNSFQGAASFRQGKAFKTLLRSFITSLLVDVLSKSVFVSFV